MAFTLIVYNSFERNIPAASSNGTIQYMLDSTGGSCTTYFVSVCAWAYLCAVGSIASMGLSRDRRAPIELNDTQQKEVRNDPLLASLRGERETYKQELKVQGFYPLSRAKGTDLHDRYERTNKEIASTYQQLYRLRLKRVIREFHDSIDTIEIAKQLNGKTAVEVLTLPPAEFELRERATIAAMLFKPIKKDKTRMKFVHTLVCLFPLRETRRPKATKSAAAESGLESYEAPTAAKRKTSADIPKKCTISHNSKLIKQEPDQSECEDFTEIEPHHLYPNVPPHPVCGFCYGNKQLSRSQRIKHWWRKDVLNKHVNIHLRDVEYQREFNCPYPDCRSVLHGAMHFKRHSLDVHKVAH